MKLIPIIENYSCGKDNKSIYAFVRMKLDHYDKRTDTFYNETVDGKGVAVCSDADSFDEEYGKKLALSRAYKDCYTKIASFISRDLVNTSNHKLELLTKVQDCIESEVDSINRLREGVDIHNTKKKNRSVKSKIKKVFNK